MRGSSRQALAAAQERLEAMANTADTADTADLETLGGELFAVVRLLDEQPTLRRALTDPGREGGARAELVTGLLRGKVSDQAADVVSAATRQAWARPRDLADGVEHLAVLVEIMGADREGVLDALEDDLFRFGRLVANERELGAVVGDRRIPAERRRDLLVGLLEGKASPAAVRLVSQAVLAPRGLAFGDVLESYAQVAADWRDRLIATVRTAVPLTDAERQRLARILAGQYGHEVRLNLIVDPNVVGGVRIDIGADVVEGTAAGRLDDARRRIAG